jgi:hypothetical protein
MNRKGQTCPWVGPLNADGSVLSELKNELCCVWSCGECCNGWYVGGGGCVSTDCRWRESLGDAISS